MTYIIWPLINDFYGITCIVIWMIKKKASMIFKQFKCILLFLNYLIFLFGHKAYPIFSYHKRFLQISIPHFLLSLYPFPLSYICMIERTWSDTCSHRFLINNVFVILMNPTKIFAKRHSFLILRFVVIFLFLSMKEFPLLNNSLSALINSPLMIIDWR